MMPRARILGFALLVGCGGTTPTPPQHVDVEPATSPSPPVEPTPLVDAKLTGQCGALTQLGLEEHAVDLLDGRLTIAAFRGTEAPPREYNVMSAPTANAQETRTIVAAGDDRFVVLARELLMLEPGPGKLEAQAKAFYDRIYAERVPGGLAVAPFELRALRAVAGTPATVTAFGDAALVLSLLVAQPDGSLQELGFYVSPHLAAEAGCADTARQLATTLRPGPRKLDRAAGQRTLDAGSVQLRLTLPADYVVIEQPGPDFTVFHLHKLVPLGESSGQLLLYIGGHPQPPDAGTTKVKGQLLGSRVEWTGETSANGGSLEAQVPLGDGLVAHAIVASGRDRAFLDELRSVAETLTRMR
jgi:hypothetical protein